MLKFLIPCKLNFIVLEKQEIYAIQHFVMECHSRVTMIELYVDPTLYYRGHSQVSTQGWLH